MHTYKVSTASSHFSFLFPHSLSRFQHTQVLFFLFPQSLFSVGQSKFPESISKIFIMNAPSLFSGAWAILKTVLEERTRNKIIITNKVRGT